MALFAKSSPTERKQLTELLKFIVGGTQGPSHCAIAPKTMIDKLLKYKPALVATQGEVDPGGNITVVATDEGIVATGGKLGPVAVEAPAVDGPGDAVADATTTATSRFALESGFIAPPSKRGGIKANIYPFDKMEKGISFFVPATEAKPNPAKALASTVSSATKRHAAVYPEGHAKAGQSTGKNGAKFIVRARTVADGEKSDGARIYRVA